MKYNKEADLQLQLFDNIEMNNIIDHLENKTRYGADGLSTSLLRSIKSVIIKLPNNSQMLRTWFFPYFPDIRINKNRQYPKRKAIHIC